MSESIKSAKKSFGWKNVPRISRELINSIHEIDKIQSFEKWVLLKYETKSEKKGIWEASTNDIDSSQFVVSSSHKISDST